MFDFLFLFSRSLRQHLSALGCLSVQTTLNVGSANTALDENGVPADKERQEKYAGSLLKELVWWGEACRAQRSKRDPYATK